MGAYCRQARIPVHAATAGEILRVERLPSDYGQVVLFGDRGEIACIPHEGCGLEIVAVVETSHREVDRLLPGEVIRYTRSFFRGDRLALPSGKTVGFKRLVGFKLQLPIPRTGPPPVEEAVVRAADRQWEPSRAQSPRSIVTGG